MYLFGSFALNGSIRSGAIFVIQSNQSKTDIFLFFFLMRKNGEKLWTSIYFSFHSINFNSRLNIINTLFLIKDYSQILICSKQNVFSLQKHMKNLFQIDQN